MFLASFFAAALLLSANPLADGSVAVDPHSSPSVANGEEVRLSVSLVGIDLAEYLDREALPVELPDLLVDDVPPIDDEDNWALVTLKTPAGGPVVPGAVECGGHVDVVVKGFTSGTGDTKAGAYKAAMAQLLAAMPFTCSHCVVPVIYQCKAAIAPNGGTVTILAFDPIVLPGGGAGFRALLSFDGLWRFACAPCS